MNYIGAVIDVETTGLIAGVHEIIDITFIIHDDEFKPVDKFTTKIRPMRPELAEPEALLKNGLKLHELKNEPTPAQIRNAFSLWHEEIIQNKKILPLGHNFSFDKRFIEIFFGQYYNEYFHYKFRDTYILAQALKDSGLLNLSSSLSLEGLCEYFKIPQIPHTSKGDAYATLILYRKMINFMKELKNGKK